MQERNSEQTVPLSLMFKEICSAEKNSKEDHTESMSEASSHDSYYDSLSDLKEGQMNSDLTSELSAFLSQDEINKSLDLAREAFPGPETEKLNTKQESTKLLKHSPRNPSDNVSFMDTKVYKQREIGSPLMNNQRSKTTDRFIRKQTTTSNSQTSKSSTVANERKATISPLLTTSPSLIRSLQTKSSFKNSGRHSSSPQRQVLKSKSLNQGEPASQNDLRNKAATFIEELSSIFRESAKSRSRSPDGDSSSPDSGYLSPKKKQSTLNDTTLNDNSKSFAEPQKDAMSEAKMPTVNPTESSPVSKKSEPVIQHQENISGHQVASLPGGPPSVPRFTQKLRSQEVAEGSSVRLECRVAGNPTPQVRWFCEGKELHNSPDIQICSERGNLHSLVITEAFEDDTGRYTCTASNSLGLDTTSAEVFVEGASSTDSESEGSVFKSNLGAMPQAQKKTTSVSLTIGCSSPKAGVTTTVIQPLSVPVQQVQSPTSYLYRQDGSSNPAFSPPIFTKELQNITASEGQVVVLECRVKATPPLQVKWFQQGTEIHDSPDFRVLQKKPRSAAEPEEICTLVIAEAFPEDAGTFTCTARNEYGSVTCSSLLTVYSASSDGCGNDMSAREENNEDFQQFPPPPPVTELSCLELPPKKPHESLQFNHTEFEPSLGALQLQLSAAGKSANGVHPSHGINGMSNSNTAAPSPHVLLSPTKQPPPILAKPKLDPLQIQQLQNQIRLEQEVDWWNLQQQTSPQQNPPSSPSFPPPPSFQELESSQFITSPVQMNVLSSHNSPTMQPASSFNYARPKQFIAAQSMSPASGYVTPSSGSSTSSLPSPMSPPATQKQFGRASVPPFSQPFAHEGDPFWSPSSPSPPPPPPPVISPTATYAGSDSFPLPPPPPPLPGAAPSPNYSPSPSPTSRFSNSSQSPAAFLSSMLPSQQSPTSLNVLGLPKGVMPMGFPKKSGRTARIASDEEIQGTKDAVIQDLERKLRFKEELLNNGQPRLTYEEKMARRLLGADSAATVFQLQEPEEELSTQEYKVSSFEQRLISEIEYRLERSPVEESDDEVQHLDKATDSGVAPQFQMKLKHYKIFEGMPVTFTCKVTGDPKPKIYWFKDGKQISVRSDHYKIQREPDGTCSLHTTASALDDDGNYTIMAANPQGRVSCTGRLMVQAVNQRGRSPRTPPGQAHIRRPRSRSRDSGDENEPIQERFFRPHFLQAPGDLIVQEGKLCRMDCKVSGLPTPDLSWQLNGRPVRPDSSHKMLVRENGVHSLIIEPVTARDAGIYSCVATNRAGQNSFSLELIVAAKDAHKPPVFVEKLQNTGVAEGYPVRLECRVSGAPPPQIFWKKENESLTYNTDRVSMHQDNYGYICLLIQGTTKEDAGWYTVSAKNEAGIVACTARLDVYPQWQQQPHITKPKKVRPSASRYAALSDQGLDIKAAFQPEANPVHMQAELVESDDL
ncbi:palladin isoform X2 [Rhinatrema bivittatum]|uniref:palladin isoform X2 n=1 Tax=Rhinatrema bivittatum TaxID=194408 RepID=UPI00112BE0CC|nr:palladin isoform X2 [Rhinatrema bivittatum]